ncbi:LOW QUALITY PROTEIN: methyltransferase-like protein 25B, partial [Xenia sp. Carnegie-2017]|uniref:LOW QUALITY PROTEIN: methyltransferase-like protein 25B n=1 Tax=Xenia sp. Carnegie-2017 TaxID=2897299 RepID=UPI001F036272
LQTSVANVTFFVCFIPSDFARLQDKYKWMLESYVLDFFTENIWQKLPSKWPDVLFSLGPQEISYFFFEMYSLSQSTDDNVQAKLRQVWPLELLSFIAACHALRLDNQPWLTKLKDLDKKYERTTSNNGKMSTARVVMLPWKHLSKDLNQGRRHEVEQTENVVSFTAQNMAIGHPLRCYVKRKKQYEIDILSKLIFEVAKKLQCWDIVDVGAGLGHLSRTLNYEYGLRVLTIEGEGCHRKQAEKIDEKVRSKFKKHDKGSQDEQGLGRNLIHITRYIDSDITVEEFSNVVLEAFSKMENSEGFEKTKQRFIIVGLHTCGDLAATLLRVYTHCSNAVAIISVGCCYMKLTHENLNSDQNKKILTRKENSSNENEASLSARANTNASEGFEIKFQENRNISSFQSSENKNEMKNSACRMDEMKNSACRMDSKKPADQINCFTKREMILGYPLSEYVRRSSKHRMVYNAFECACHAVERYQKKLQDRSPTLKLHYYRAMLEMLLKQKDPGSERRQIRTLRTKKAAKMSLSEYVHNACATLKIQDIPTHQDILKITAIHENKEFHVVVFYVLRLLMAPLVEGLLLVDRLMFIEENCFDSTCRITKLFDPRISPRNFALLSQKQISGLTKN